MKLLQVIPVKDAEIKLKSALNQKERELRNKGTTFFKHNAHKWKHTKYNGWINITDTSGGILVAKIQSRVQESEWQLLQAFLGYLERHFLDLIESITITYRKAE
jgi:hypothetical protein